MTLDPAQSPFEPKNFEETIFFSTVRLTVPCTAPGSTSMGTGFFVASTDPRDSSKTRVFIVSNRHVLEDHAGVVTIAAHAKSPDSRLALGQAKNINFTMPGENLIRHPNDSIDLACFNASGMFTGEAKNAGCDIFHRHIALESIVDFSDDRLGPLNNPLTPKSHAEFLGKNVASEWQGEVVQRPRLHPGIEAWFVGYPDNRYDTVHNLPILRLGRVASIPRIDFNGRPEFLIDAQVFPGSSGSPVFVIVRGHAKFAGVVTQTMIKHDKLQAIPAYHALGITTTIGLGIVIKATAVAALISHAHDVYSQMPASA